MRDNFWSWKGGNICASYNFRTGWQPFSKFIVMFIKFFRWTIFHFLVVWVPLFHCISDIGVNFTVTLNISYLMEGWSEISFFLCCMGGNICAGHKIRAGWPSFSKFIVMFIKFFWLTIFEFLSVCVPPFHCSYAVGVTHERSFLCHNI